LTEININWFSAADVKILHSCVVMSSHASSWLVSCCALLAKLTCLILAQAG